MYFRRKLDKHKAYFLGVAMAVIIAGAAILALGLVELGLNLWDSSNYYSPLSKVIGGLVVLALGYIHLELEEIRVK